ncbi:hypothetical protein MFIFM68171_00593 [Madurella fahalii]|uniref:AA1-like domain-containing protein n=1 Tax=Madurella fahalii TaxID=1157608 RepID=A0ABQ0FY21_9PEZI
MLHFIFALAAVILFAAASPTYKLSKTMLKTYPEQDDCTLPEKFVVQNFRLWVSKADKQTAVVDFKYSDSSTRIDTACHFDSSSVNVGLPGMAPRFACNNPSVQFILENSSLTMIEKACFESNPARPYEAAGTVKPELDCVETGQDSQFGEGMNCVGVPATISGKFTSLQPTPQ